MGFWYLNVCSNLCMPMYFLTLAVPVYLIVLFCDYLWFFFLFFLDIIKKIQWQKKKKKKKIRWLPSDSPFRELSVFCFASRGAKGTSIHDEVKLTSCLNSTQKSLPPSLKLNPRWS